MEYSKNELYDVVITDISETGEGIGRIDGYTLFVKDAVLGDTVTAKLTKVKKNYAFARMERIIEPSLKRCEPVCSLHRRCGGCQIQALSYEAQLEFKWQKVFGNLQRIGGFDKEFLEGIFERVVGMDDPYRYRNKSQYPIGTDRSGNIVAGFYAGRTHEIIPAKDCAIGISENQEILDIIISHMAKYKISAYDETTGRGLIRHVLIRKGFSTGQLMVCIVIAKKGKVVKSDSGAKGRKEIEYIKASEELIENLSKIEGMTSISVSINTENTNVIMGNEIHTLWGEDYITDILLGKKYRISPLAFYQVNHEQCEKLYSTVSEFANLEGTEEVYDICCGIGTITLHLSGAAGFVHGIEIVPEAINDAKYNAKANNIDNADFVCADATVYLKENKDTMKADLIVMDPPRKGMSQESLEAVIEVAPPKIVYVSCDPATLARDLKILCENGYILERVRPVDMFPHSVHIETVCLLKRTEN